MFKTRPEVLNDSYKRPAWLGYNKCHAAKVLLHCCFQHFFVEYRACHDIQPTRTADENPHDLEHCVPEPGKDARGQTWGFAEKVQVYVLQVHRLFQLPIGLAAYKGGNDSAGRRARNDSRQKPGIVKRLANSDVQGTYALASKRTKSCSAA